MAWVLLIVFLGLTGAVVLYLFLLHKNREAGSRPPAARGSDAEEAARRLALVADQAAFTLGVTSMPVPADQRSVQPRPAASIPRVAIFDPTGATAAAPVPVPVRKTSIPPAIRRENQSAASAGSLRWTGVRSTIPIGDLTLFGPLAYFVDSRRQPRHGEPAAVDLALPVGPRGWHSGQRELGYWPRYDELTPGQRRNYLEWLASGRAFVPPELGCFFLFMYGMERRALIDRADHALIFDEVLRLRDLYVSSGQPVSRSFDNYTTCFLWFLVVAFPGAIAGKQVERLALATRVWTEESLASMLGWFADLAAPLPAWAAYAVADFLPQTPRSVIIRRVGEEFRDLFAAKYRVRFGPGIGLQSSKRPLRHAYKAASSVIEAAEVTIPNPLGLTSQFKPLAEIWSECLAELKQLSSVVARQGSAEALTPAAWEALPAELRAGVDHPLAASVHALVERAAREDGRIFVPVRDLAHSLGVELTGAGRLTPRQARNLCQTVEWTDYCVEPDARLTGAGYGDGEVVSLYLRTNDDRPDPARYAAAATMLRAGFVVAATDGHVHEEEVEVLGQQVRQAFELSDVESRRLEVLRSLLEESPPEPSTLGRTLRALPGAHRAAMAKLLVALVAADGVVSDDEQKALRRGYAALGLAAGEADAVLVGLAAPCSAAEDAPVTIARAVAGGPGEAIPPPPSRRKPAGLRLDRAAIAAIMNDTREVARMLAEAMQAAPDDARPPESPSAAVARPATQAVPTSATPPAIVAHDVVAVAAGPDVVQTDDPTLPARYAVFYRLLLARAQWELPEVEALARQHGHMLSGAVEALNDWAYDKYGGQLFVEDGGRLVVETALLN